MCKELAGRHVAVIFDGTTRLGEALAIVLCYVSDEWTQRAAFDLATVTCQELDW